MYAGIGFFVVLGADFSGVELDCQRKALKVEKYGSLREARAPPCSKKAKREWVYDNYAIGEKAGVVIIRSMLWLFTIRPYSFFTFTFFFFLEKNKKSI